MNFAYVNIINLFMEGQYETSTFMGFLILMNIFFSLFCCRTSPPYLFHIYFDDSTLPQAKFGSI